MVKPAEKIIYIQDCKGTLVRFDPVELQTQLIHCFLSAGLRENSYMAEDIALAVEYTLLNSSRSDAVFGQGELAAAVIRTLEETGFPEVAALFRQCGGDRQVAINADPISVSKFLQKFLACPNEIFEEVVQKVSRAIELLGIHEADPHLYLELARYYERKFAMESITGGALAWLRGKSSASKDEIASVLPPEVRDLVAAGVLRISEVNEIFSRIRFFFMMQPFAKKFNLTPPVTEMVVEPLLFRMSRILECGRAAIDSALQPSEPLPVQLTIPDMSGFLTEYFGAEQEKSRKLMDELAGALSFELKNEIYKLSVL